MMKMDRSTQLTLVLFLLFLGWIGFQIADSDGVPKKSSKAMVKSQQTPSSSSSSKPNTSEVPKPKVGTYVSGFSGSVLVDGKMSLTPENTLSSTYNAVQFSSKNDAWVSFELEKGSFIFALESSTFEVKESNVILNEGVFYVSNVGRNATFTAKSIPLSITGDATIVVESKKVRLFALNQPITLSVFGKNEKIETGKGSSLFIDEKRVTSYDLAPSIRFEMKPSQELSWTTKNQVSQFYLFTKSEKTSQNEIRVNRAFSILNASSKTFKLADSEQVTSLFSVNKSSSWSAK